MENLTIHNCEQGSDEWLKVRLGKITASHFSDVMAKGTGKTRKDYMISLATERLTGLANESYSNSFMQWGVETEPEARVYYEALYEQPISQVGFVQINEWVGCSPDGLVSDEGLIEIKCPKSTTHVSTILDDKIQSCYIPQVQGQLWVTGRKWCDWISFDPRVKSNPFYMVRVRRDEKYIENLQKEVDLFVDQLQDMINCLTKTIF